MKKLLFLFAALSSVCAFAQNKEEAKQLTKFEQYASATGRIVKFQDVKMPSIPGLILSGLQTSIRMIMGAGQDAFFYRIEEPETTRSIAHIAMIEYSDLVEINNALKTLTASVESDIAANPDYLENKFRTEDGMEVGYYVSNGKANWFLKLERYTSSTVFPKNQEVIVDAFKNAQAKIEELKAQR